MSEENVKKGGISVEREHIFPVIKKWLYSEKDIFLREIVSNASDAITKLRRLSSLGETDCVGENEQFRIDVVLDKDAKTLTVTDNGIGMTAEEVEKYICSIALSGALDFIQKYEGEGKEAGGNGIIGHFGLGFYSSFMVSDTVELTTKSYTGAPSVHWVCSESGEYTVEPGDREERGTEIIMHITDEEKEYLDADKIKTILNKYCAFMPEDVFFDDGSVAEEDKTEDDEKDEKPINDKNPLWKKAPSECTDEEYKEFYHKVFSDYRDPLFWIHINADYPLNFKGILYFPPITNPYENIEGKVKLFYNQVFVADDIKEVIPEYLLMLRGVLDCPELPLNVSRSYLQNNAYISKVSAHIVKKVTDKLNSLAKNDRENYVKVWSDIRTFVEYACCRDRKFYDKAKDALLLTLTNGSSETISEYLEKCKEKHENLIYYTNDRAAQAQYISLFTAQDIEIAVFDSQLDVQFLSMIESYNSDVKYRRIDADLADALKGDGDVTENQPLTDLFKKVSGKEKLTVSVQPLKDASTPAVLNVSEESRRMDEMMKMYARNGMGFGGDYPMDETLIVNTNSPVIEKLNGILDTDAEKAELIASHVYRLAVLSQRRLTADELNAFLSESCKLLSLL